jgi:hypothetical protein
MASENFSHLTQHLALARVNFGADTFKAVLVSSIPDETALDTWDFLNDVTNEITDVDYTAGGFAVTASVAAVDAANNRIAVTYSAASPTYSSATISAVGCIIYKDTTVAGTSPLCHFVDFGETVSSTNGNFTVSFSTPFYINR